MVAALLPLAFGVAACSSSSSSGGGGEPGSAAAVMQPLINGDPKGAAPVGSLTPNEYTTTDITDGQVRAALAKVDEMGATVMQRTGIPGMAIAVVHHGQVVYAKGFGVREVGKPDTVNL